MKKTYYNRVDETLYEFKLDNGLDLFIIPKHGFQKSYVTMTAKYGSIHNDFYIDDTLMHMPKGIAHFLEHKMFEKEDGDMFNAFSKYGSSANAFTSYDRTSYLFTTVESLKENIKLLMDMLNTPYFTEESVQKEVGIIAEEIKMYQDQPNYKLYYQTMNAMYHTHPVKYDIAGTVDSISEITDKTLYQCFETFYHPENMVMFIVGDVDPFDLYTYVNEISYKHKEFNDVMLMAFEEPANVYQPYIQSFENVQKDKLMLGIKTQIHTYESSHMKLEMEVLFALDLLFGEQTEFYQSLLEDHLIDDSFGFNFIIEPTFSHILIAGATDQPEVLKERLLNQLHNFEALYDQTAFDRLVKQTIGEYVSSMNSPEYIANQFTRYFFNGAILFDLLPILESLSLSGCIQTYKATISGAAVTDSRMLPNG
ncbi:insulinase family protein [Macrococcus armenti]|uniref:EF-P 5-aminopentanol modification-associated protein YfmH n=1 Tax=Macrococcus armenti TaxID=2875764 RepID=UPI001CCB5865|nr:pitrilysin family protein [Macrococcus armenti]UBH23313.1 insulinase family protein [Macrococcus armenti]